MNHLHRTLGFVLAATAFVTVESSTQAQQYTNVGGTNVPNLGSATEACKFGDWDLDGDLDLVYANGGDPGNQQSRLLINQGGVIGGGAGLYVDKTATQLVPNFVMSSRDVQTVDIDDDGDLDFYFSNHSMNNNQTSVWFVNQGGMQGARPALTTSTRPDGWGSGAQARRFTRRSRSRPAIRSAASWTGAASATSPTSTTTATTT